jgi:hypothetical protein
MRTKREWRSNITSALSIYLFSQRAHTNGEETFLSIAVILCTYHVFSAVLERAVLERAVLERIQVPIILRVCIASVPVVTVSFCVPVTR